MAEPATDATPLTHYRFPATQSASLKAVIPKDSQGNLVTGVQLDNLQWSCSDLEIAVISIRDGLPPALVPQGVAGTVTITVTGDSDPTTPQYFTNSVTVEFYTTDEVASVGILLEPI